MKLRLTLLFAVIALLGFTAASKHKFKVTNAVELCLPSTFVYHEEDSIEVKNSLNIILDTERDANGNAVRRHIYFFERKNNVEIHRNDFQNTIKDVKHYMYYLHCLGITKAIIDPMNILI